MVNQTSAPYSTGSSKYCRSRSRCRSVPSINKIQFVGVLVIMNLIDAGSSQVCNSHRLIVISHQRSCVPISSYQYRKCSSRTGRYSLSGTDIESPNIIPVTERMVREFKSNILRTDCHSHRRKSIEVCSSD